MDRGTFCIHRREQTSLMSLLPRLESGLELLTAATCHPLSPSHSSLSTSIIATIETPSNGTIERVETASVSGHADTNDSSALNFPISFRRIQVGDFQVNETLDLSDILSVEPRVRLNSWLMDDNFDLDDLNSSLLQASSGDLLTVERMPDEDPLPLDNLTLTGRQRMRDWRRVGNEIRRNGTPTVGRLRRVSYPQTRRMTAIKLTRLIATSSLSVFSNVCKPVFFLQLPF